MKSASLMRRALLVALGAAAALMAAVPAGAVTPYPNPTFGPYNSRIDPVRATGSDTTYFLQQRLSDLYNGSPGCSFDATLEACTGTPPAVSDNWDHDEVTQAYPTGSGNGIKQLCGVTPHALPVDYARSSRDRQASDCNNGTVPNTFRAYAKDGIVPIVFPNTGNCSPAAGYRTGDTCGGTPSGRPVTNLTQQNLIDILGPSPRVTDWGQLTDPAANPGATPPVYGAADGQPIVVWGVQTGSGTYLAYKNFVTVDPNTNSTPGHIVFENNASQITTISQQEQCGSPTTSCAGSVDQESRSLYFMSYGRYLTSPFTRAAGIATKVNNRGASQATILSGLYPVTRNLYNVFRPDTVSQATRAFLNWTCNTGPNTHQIDPETGLNYDSEISSTISTQFGFPRIACVDV